MGYTSKSAVKPFISKKGNFMMIVKRELGEKEYIALPTEVIAMWLLYKTGRIKTNSEIYTLTKQEKEELLTEKKISEMKEIVMKEIRKEEKEFKEKLEERQQRIIEAYNDNIRNRNEDLTEIYNRVYREYREERRE